MTGQLINHRKETVLNSWQVHITEAGLHHHVAARTLLYAKTVCISDYNNYQWLQGW